MHTCMYTYMYMYSRGNILHTRYHKSEFILESATGKPSAISSKHPLNK